ncbi:DNA-binding protein [Bacteroidia bacterium]|nr:DNA-binding protein [Bacteroidia bacterium]GHT46061.1 DNA-binding protein [Bacteroidia bacterium]
MSKKDEIILYQPDNSIRLEVRLEDETVWLTQMQMVVLFDRDKSVISRHITNIYKEGELEESATVAKYATVQNEKNRYVERQIEFYNLDMIISVGYRVKSKHGILFRQWATKTLKEYILKGYAVNQRFERIEYRVTEAEKKIDFFVRTALPPVEGIFYDGQIFDAYKFASDLIKSAKNSIVLIDNYIDESVLILLSKRTTGVDASIYTAHISQQLRLDLQRHNAQYPHINVLLLTRSHDRFLFIDNDVYHIGASLKDLGKKWFAFSKLELKVQELLENII